MVRRGIATANAAAPWAEPAISASHQNGSAGRRDASTAPGTHHASANTACTSGSSDALRSTAPPVPPTPTNAAPNATAMRVPLAADTTVATRCSRTAPSWRIAEPGRSGRIARAIRDTGP